MKNSLQKIEKCEIVEAEKRVYFLFEIFKGRKYEKNYGFIGLGGSTDMMKSTLKRKMNGYSYKSNTKVSRYNHVCKYSYRDSNPEEQSSCKDRQK